MKKSLSILIAVLAILVLLSGCASKSGPADTPQPSAEVSADVTARTITKDMAFDGVNNYCQSAYDWSPAETDPSIMYVTPGEETESAFQVIFRSYTGAFVYFLVDKSSGNVSMTERVPGMDIEADAGSFNLFDYLKPQ